MIIYDTEGLARKQALTRMEEGQERFMLGCQNEVKDHIHVDRIKNAEERMGKPMWPKEFEEKLLKLNPNFYFEVIKENPSKKRLSLIDARGKVYIGVYENSLMPERSIPRLKEMIVPEPKLTHIDRKDISSDPEALKPGWRKITIPWGEKTRGWRTVLVRLIQSGYASVSQVETEFGSDETPEWRQHTGKGEYTSPF